MWRNPKLTVAKLEEGKVPFGFTEMASWPKAKYIWVLQCTAMQIQRDVGWNPQPTLKSGPGPYWAFGGSLKQKLKFGVKCQKGNRK